MSKFLHDGADAEDDDRAMTIPEHFASKIAELIKSIKVAFKNNKLIQKQQLETRYY